MDVDMGTYLDARALVELFKDGEQEGLLVGIALELLEHLPRPLGDLEAVFTRRADVQPEQALERRRSGLGSGEVRV